MGRLAGKVALISGGARGQGAAEARLFAKEGARVVVGDVLEEVGMELAAEINRGGGGAFFIRLDVTSAADWQAAVKAADDGYGRLDVLVNNAGAWRGGRVEETTEDDWDFMFDVNAKGVFLGTRAAVPAMRRAGGGSIVNVSSIVAMVGVDRATAYPAAKGAVRTFTKLTAIQYAGDGIRANSIHPGPVETDLLRQVFGGREINAYTPLGRLGTPEDIAFAALYLACDESSFVTGSELVVDGGALAE